MKNKLIVAAEAAALASNLLEERHEKEMEEARTEGATKEQMFVTQVLQPALPDLFNICFSLVVYFYAIRGIPFVDRTESMFETSLVSFAFLAPLLLRYSYSPPDARLKEVILIFVASCAKFSIDFYIVWSFNSH
jgi:hypothetical protein